MGVLEQAYNTAMEKPLQILEIFNDFFGEDKVDMQGVPSLSVVEAALPRTAGVAAIKHYIDAYEIFILVHFPHVRVTNEFDKFTDINHLFAKVVINTSGQLCGRFALNRSEYSLLHFINGYMHSHISCIPTADFRAFQNPCTGSGPINNTICSLNREFDADLWNLFCLELSKFVQVESVAGTPYHRLESLVQGGYSSQRVRFDNIFLQGYLNLRSITAGYSTLTMANIADFIKYVIDSNELKFAYQSGSYTLAMSSTEYFIRISNLFIKWYNKKHHEGALNFTLEELMSSRIIKNYKYTNGHIVEESNNRMNYASFIGREVCTFKGEVYRITIPDAAVENEADSNYVLIVCPEIGNYIFTKIFNVINFKYGKTVPRNEPHKKVKYI
jgi:hypothetical protein